MTCGVSGAEGGWVFIPAMNRGVNGAGLVGVRLLIVG